MIQVKLQKEEIPRGKIAMQQWVGTVWANGKGRKKGSLVIEKNREEHPELKVHFFSLI